MTVRVKFNTSRLRREIKKQMNRRLKTASHELADAIQAEISTPGPAPSQPGQPPHRQTGQLHGSVKPATPPEYGVEINTPYAVHLEYGTRIMRPRPFVLPTLVKKRHDLQSILRKQIRIR